MTKVCTYLCLLRLFFVMEQIVAELAIRLKTVMIASTMALKQALLVRFGACSRQVTLDMWSYSKPISLMEFQCCVNSEMLSQWGSISEMFPQIRQCVDINLILNWGTLVPRGRLVSPTQFEPTIFLPEAERLVNPGCTLSMGTWIVPSDVLPLRTPYFRWMRRSWTISTPVSHMFDKVPSSGTLALLSVYI